MVEHGMCRNTYKNPKIHQKNFKKWRLKFSLKLMNIMLLRTPGCLSESLYRHLMETDVSCSFTPDMFNSEKSLVEVIFPSDIFIITLKTCLHQNSPSNFGKMETLLTCKSEGQEPNPLTEFVVFSFKTWHLTCHCHKE